MLLRQPDEQVLMDNGERIRRNDQPAARLASELGDSLFDFRGVANRRRRHVNCDWPWHGFERTQVNVVMGDVSGLNMSAARETPGATSLSISSHFPTI